MKYITMHDGDQTFSALFSLDLRHRDVYRELKRLHDLHLRDEDDVGALCPSYAGYINFHGDYYDTFDRSTTLNLPSSPSCGQSINERMHQTQPMQFLKLANNQFIALTASIFKIEVFRAHQELRMLGHYTPQWKPETKKFRLSSTAGYVPGPSWNYGADEERVLENLINCRSPYAHVAGL